MQPLISRPAIVALLASLGVPTAAVVGQQRAATRDTTFAPSLCGAPRTAASDTIDRAVLAWMKRSRTPAASIAVVRRGRVAAERAYGWADLVNCVPATPAMRFGIGSISKQITALGVLVLVQQGKLTLDDPIVRWLPEAGDRWNGIVVRHLLTHTSGIRDTGHDDNVYPQIELDKKQELAAPDLIKRLAADSLNFAAGDAWAYSNTGYLLLSLIIERASGAPFPAWMRDHVFEPLGMHATRYFDAAEIVPALARGYSIQSNQLRQGYFSSGTYSHMGDYGMISTAHDMALWSAELDSSRLVSPALHASMVSPVRLRDSTTFPYGFGVTIDDYRGEPLLGHSGTYNAGYSASLVVLPDRDLSVIVLSNQHQGDPWNVSGTILSLVDPTLTPVASLRPHRDDAPERTKNLAALLNGDANGTPTTPSWRRLRYPQLRGFLSAMLPLTVEFIACDDVTRRHIELFGATAQQECYYRLHHGPVERVLGVLYAPDGRIMHIPRR